MIMIIIIGRRRPRQSVAQLFTSVQPCGVASLEMALHIFRGVVSVVRHLREGPGGSCGMPPSRQWGSSATFALLHALIWLTLWTRGIAGAC